MYIYMYIMTLGMWGSPRDEALDHWQCEKIPLFALFSCHRQLIFMLLLCEHMSCMLASRWRFFKTFQEQNFVGNMSKLRGFACWWAMPWLVDVKRRLKSTAPVSQNDCLVVNYNELGAPATWFTLYDIHIHFHPFTHICSFLWPALPPKLALKVNVSKQKANFGRKVGLKNAEVIMHLDV